MRRRCGTVLIALLVASSLLAASASAELAEKCVAHRRVSTLSTQAHPKSLELAYLATEKQSVVQVALSYRLNRNRWDPCCDIDLASGGKMIAVLKIRTETGVQKVGKKRAKCKVSFLEDVRNQRSCDLRWPFEVDLEPGDVVLWNVTFKGMSRLEREPYMDTFYTDTFGLEGSVTVDRGLQ